MLQKYFWGDILQIRHTLLGEDIAEQPRKERNQSIDKFILILYYYLEKDAAVKQDGCSGI